MGVKQAEKAERGKSSEGGSKVTHARPEQTGMDQPKAKVLEIGTDALASFTGKASGQWEQAQATQAAQASRYVSGPRRVSLLARNGCFCMMSDERFARDLCHRTAATLKGKS